MNTQADIDAVFEDAEYGIVETGGGGEAWENRIGNYRVLITDLGGTRRPTVADDILLVGIYREFDESGEPVYLEEYNTAARAVRGAALMVAEYLAEQMA